ncbi:MAG: S9 family peptidase [Candidatus Azobacteroides sp.]|nr:S9 family peptidase [Candidatus Azobacteroides sp.]
MKKIGLLFLCFFFISVLYAQTGNNLLLLEDIVEKKYTPRDDSKMQTMPDGEYYTVLSSDKKAILRYAYSNGKLMDTLFFVDKTRETRLDSIDGYLINSTANRLLVWNETESIYRRSWQAKVYEYDIRRNRLQPLSDAPGKIRNPAFSPDGRIVSFVRDNNLWLKKLDYDTESPATKDGELGKILNGIADWVYEEEFSQTNLSAWSPDSRFLAFVKSDETEVPTFSFQVFDGSGYPDSYNYKYPYAGQKNSKAACYVFDVETKDIQKMDIPLDEDGYIPRICFTENPEQLAVMTLNRHQDRFKLYFANPKSTLSQLILHDENNYYIDSEWIRQIAFSKDHLAYVSEKDGFAHIYLYSLTGVLERQLTSGNWDVTKLYGIHPETKNVYYQSAEESPLRRSVYRVDAKGNKTRLSTQTGTNNAQFSANFHYFVNYFSNISTPAFVSICDEKGKELSVLNDNAEVKNRLAAVRFSQKEFFSFTNDNGDILNGWMIKPSLFERNKQYPAVMIQYSGPNSQEVVDKYQMDWYYYLAEQGYVVAAVDGRGTGARGEAFRKCTYLKLGLLESDDQISAAKYLARQNFIDPARIAIWGWSYGGFITLMSMSRGNGIFKAGIAIAPVTDWRFYNSIYSERFMRTPEENFTNYDLCSPLKYVRQLQGNLLLVHGTSDDNVHYLNTLYYSEALTEAGKDFDMQIYANKNHSILGEKTRLHLYTHILNFLKKND